MTRAEAAEICRAMARLERESVEQWEARTVAEARARERRMMEDAKR
jgi:hypothetical protein